MKIIFFQFNGNFLVSQIFLKSDPSLVFSVNRFYFLRAYFLPKMSLKSNKWYFSFLVPSFHPNFLINFVGDFPSVFSSFQKILLASPRLTNQRLAEYNGNSLTFLGNFNCFSSCSNSLRLASIKAASLHSRTTCNKL